MQYWYTFFVLFFAVGLAVLIVHCAVNAVAKHSPKMYVLRSVPCWRLVALLPLAVVCTILAFRKGPPLRTDSDPPDDPEDELRFSSITVTSNSVTLEVAWPTNMFPFGTTLDLFTAPTLTSRWVVPGVHEGAGWTGLHLPAHLVLITSPDGGRSRACTLRCHSFPFRRCWNEVQDCEVSYLWYFVGVFL